MKISILILSLSLSIQLFAQKEELMNLLPTGEQLNSFELKAEPEYYQGDDLFLLINGGADIYLEYGFKDVISASFANKTGLNFKAEIYQMLNDSATYGIFSFNSGNRIVTHNIGDACVIQNDFLIFIKGNYYTVLTSSSNKEEQQLNLVGFAVVISDKIEVSGFLPKLVAEHKDIALNPVYFLGNLALSNKYLFDHSDIFQFSDGLLIEKDKVLTEKYPWRWLVIKLLENDTSVIDIITKSSASQEVLSQKEKSRKQKRLVVVNNSWWPSQKHLHKSLRYYCLMSQHLI